MERPSIKKEIKVKQKRSFIQPTFEKQDELARKRTGRIVAQWLLWVEEDPLL